VSHEHEIEVFVIGGESGYGIPIEWRFCAIGTHATHQRTIFAVSPGKAMDLMVLIALV